MRPLRHFSPEIIPLFNNLYVEEIDMQKVALLVKGMRGRILVSRGPKPYITVKKSSGQSPLDTLEEAFNLLREEVKNDI